MLNRSSSIMFMHWIYLTWYDERVCMYWYNWLYAVGWVNINISNAMCGRSCLAPSHNSKPNVLSRSQHVEHFVLIRIQSHHMRWCVQWFVSLSVTFSVKSCWNAVYATTTTNNEVYPIWVSVRLVFTRWLFRSCCRSYISLMFFFFFLFYFIFMRVCVLPVSVCVCKPYTKLHCASVA